MPLYEYYIRSGNETTGPHADSFVANRISSGGLAEGATVARVLKGTSPSPSDFLPAASVRLTSSANVAPRREGYPPAYPNDEPASHRPSAGVPSPGASTSNGAGQMTLAYLCAVLGVILVVAGLVVMHQYEGGTDLGGSFGSVGGDGPVGGDAYNYIIRANWGIGWVSAGVAAEVLAAVLALGSIRTRLAPR